MIGAILALAAVGGSFSPMGPGASVRTDWTPKPWPPRELSQESKDRLAAAEAKRARKRAKLEGKK
jgi:hypothetical protein